MTPVISNGERLIALITTSSAPLGNALSILLPVLTPISLRRHFSSLTLLPSPRGPKAESNFEGVCVRAYFSAGSQDLPRE